MLPTAPAPDETAAANGVTARVQRHGLEWLAPLLTSNGKLKHKMRPKAVAEAMGCSESLVYELIRQGQLESIGRGSHHSVLTRSVMVHLWESWSGRHYATPNQVMTFLLLLLGLLPNVALRQLQLAAEELIKGRTQAERALNLRAAAEQPRPISAPAELFTTDD